MGSTVLAELLRAGADVVAGVLRLLARRHQYLTSEFNELGEVLRGLAGRAAPAVAATKGYGVITTATLLVPVGSSPGRIRSGASFAALCGASSIAVSSGKMNRFRFNRGGDRQANGALHQIVLVRLSSEQGTKDYAARSWAKGKSKKDVL